MHESSQRRPLTRRTHTYTSMGLGLTFWLAAQAALVFTAAKDNAEVLDCFANPSKPECKNANDFYPLEAVENDMSSLCMMMPWMSGCIVREKCKAGTAHGKYCSSWSLLADMCSSEWGETMDGMKGCHNYTALCAPNSVVTQCFGDTNKGIPFLVSTSTAISDTLALCEQMPDMAQCSQCSSSSNPRSACPTPLQTLSDICKSMYMEDCLHWSTMCEKNPEGLAVFCGAEQQQCAGSMQMYFHSGLQDYVLFKEWVPCTQERYNAAVFGVFLASTFAVLLKVLRFRMERRMSARRRMKSEGLRTSLLDDRREREMEDRGARCNLIVAEATLFPTSLDDVRENVVRSAFVGLTMTLDYGLMLIAMTFNVGLFFAVIAGAMLGALLFGHAGQKEQRGRRVGGEGGEGDDLQELSFEDEAAGSAALEDRACCQNT